MNGGFESVLRHNLPVLIALVLAASFGVAEGIWTSRWRPDSELNSATARLANVPLTFGDWEGSTHKLDQRQVTLAKLAGYVMCNYVNRRSGETMSVLLVCGPPGPISAHTPEICFPGGGFEMNGKPVRHVFEIQNLKTPAEFWEVRFEKEQSAVHSSSVLWSWTTDGAWAAPDSPRIRFGRFPALYKLYVIHPIVTPEQGTTQDRYLEEFVHDFLPVVQNALFPPS
jgi:hypothetical protein